MDLLPNESLAYELLPFVRHWASSEARWSILRTVFQALEWACQSVVTQNHWTCFALLCSVLHRAKEVGPDDGHPTASIWCQPKPYPPSLVTVVSQKPPSMVLAWQQGFDCLIPLLHEWSWTDSDLLDESRRILLRSFKAAALDFSLLLRAAMWRQQNGGEDLPEQAQLTP